MSMLDRKAVDFDAFTRAYRKAQEEAGGFVDIDTIYKACRREKVFGVQAKKRALETFEKDQIRAILKSNLLDFEGTPLRSASIVVQDKDTGERKRAYRQEMLLDVGELVQVIHYWQGCKGKCDERIRYYRDLAVRLHGQTVQGLLPLED